MIFTTITEKNAETIRIESEGNEIFVLEVRKGKDYDKGIDETEKAVANVVAIILEEGSEEADWEGIAREEE